MKKGTHLSEESKRKMSVLDEVLNTVFGAKPFLLAIIGLAKSVGIKKEET